MRHCNICLEDNADNLEETSVRSNVKKFSAELFAIWRCPHCLSIHASDEVDLDHYYRHYPFHNIKETKVDWILSAVYGTMLRRLKRAGLKKDHRILDYGCGSGALVEYLRSSGYGYTAGFDQYSERYGDRGVLQQSYDMVVSQDVLEHVPDPWELLRAIHTVTKPGAAIVIGTPNAASIDLREPEQYIHALHQPYHRNIFSSQALLDAGEKMGWKLERYYPTMYFNSWVPFANESFLFHYLRCFDNNVDLVLEPIRMSNWRLWTPLTLFHALFGALIAPTTDGMAVFRRG